MSKWIKNLLSNFRGLEVYPKPFISRKASLRGKTLEIRVGRKMKEGCNVLESFKFSFTSFIVTYLVSDKM